MRRSAGMGYVSVFQFGRQLWEKLSKCPSRCTSVHLQGSTEALPANVPKLEYGPHVRIYLDLPDARNAG